MVKKFLAMVVGLFLLASLAWRPRPLLTACMATARRNLPWPPAVRGSWDCYRPWRRASIRPMHGKTTLQWIKAGSGKSLQLLKDKKVDLIMVHAPAAEKKAVQEGWATDRTLIGSNEFYLVGPASDPAKIAAAKSAAGRLPPHRRGQGQVFFPGGQFRHP